MEKEILDQWSEWARQSFESDVVEGLVHEMAKQRVPSPYEKEEHFLGRTKESLLTSFDQYEKQLEKGMELLVDSGRCERLRDPSLWQPMIQDKEKVVTALRGGTSMKEQLQLSSEEIMSCYEVATDYYNRKSFEESSAICCVLLLWDSMVPAFWFGLGLSEEALARHDSAVVAYTMAAELSEDDLHPYLLAARCLIHLKRNTQAKRVLNRAIVRAGDKRSFQEVKKHAMEMEKSFLK